MPFAPKAILEQVGEDKIYQRFHSLFKLYEAQSQKRWVNTFMQKDVLLHAVESYFCDLQHSKNFHDFNLADQHKRAAFTLKWLVKCRPIQFQETAELKSPKDLLINEMFALEAALVHLEIGAKPKSLSNPLLSSLIYTLHHRTIDAEAMAAMMYTIERALTGTPP